MLKMRVFSFLVHDRLEKRLLVRIVVSLDKYRRRKDNIEIIPVKEFLTDLWGGKIY